MKILLTGGSGFIGKNIRESFLGEKHQLHAPSRAELDCFDDDSVAGFFSRHSFDVVIHSAAKPGHRNVPDAKGILYANSRMTLNLLKYHSSWGKLINMGSGAIYDMDHYLPKMEETYFGKYIPRDEHGYNKYICGLLFPHYSKCIDLRIFGIFGKYEDYAIRFISNAICKALFDLPITIKQNRRFDFLFIDDLMPVLDYFIENEPAHNAYNITPDSSIELLRVAEIVREITRTKDQIVIAKEGMGIEYSGNNTRLRNEFKSLQFTPIEDAITKLVMWYKANRHVINKDFLLTDK